MEKSYNELHNFSEGGTGGEMVACIVEMKIACRRLIEEHEAKTRETDA
jgi:hypothetical protein